MTTSYATEIKSKRQRLGITQKEFADALGLDRGGDRTFRSWENGEHRPHKIILNAILDYPENPPFLQNGIHNKFKFIDLFAGIGGFRLAFNSLGGKCVFTSEWDKFSQKTYRLNFGEEPAGDITEIPSVSIPDTDILCAGFPCQPFSQAGKKRGFDDTRGTLFYDIQRILVDKRPKAFVLENVKQLRGHNKGQTLKVMLEVLRGEHDIGKLKKDLKDTSISDEAFRTLTTKLNYWVDFKVLSAKDFGVPQKRERIFIIGFDRDRMPEGFDIEKHFHFPEGSGEKVKVGDILQKKSEIADKYTISERIWAGHINRKLKHRAKGNGFGFSLFDKKSPYTNTISARYYKDGSEVLIDQPKIGRPRMLTPRECARLQGFPEEFLIPVSNTRAYRQFGNSVPVPVVEAVGRNMIKAMKKAKMI